MVLFQTPISQKVLIVGTPTQLAKLPQPLDIVVAGSLLECKNSIVSLGVSINWLGANMQSARQRHHPCLYLPPPGTVSYLSGPQHENHVNGWTGHHSLAPRLLQRATIRIMVHRKQTFLGYSASRIVSCGWWCDSRIDHTYPMHRWKCTGFRSSSASSSNSPSWLMRHAELAS